MTMRTDYGFHSRKKQLARDMAAMYALPPAPKPVFTLELSSTQCLDAKIIHWDLIDRFTSGQADGSDLWDWIETGYTYARIMQLHMDAGADFTQEAIGAISDQIDIYMSVISRYRVHKRVGFSGPELRVARAAAAVMDGLIDIDKDGIAVVAAYWSMAQMDKIRALGSSAM